MFTTELTRERRLELYREHGAESRKEYVSNLAETYGVPRAVAFEMANLLGPDEDFDGLVTMLEDMEGDDFSAFD